MLQLSLCSHIDEQFFLYVALNNNVFLKFFFPYPLLIEKSSLQSISEGHSQQPDVRQERPLLCVTETIVDSDHHTSTHGGCTVQRILLLMCK